MGRSTLRAGGLDFVSLDIDGGPPAAPLPRCQPLRGVNMNDQQTSFEDPSDWMEEEFQTLDRPFFPLSGDEGTEYIIFEGPPNSGQSNFDEEKKEYRFPVKVFNKSDGTMVDYYVTESGSNFRGKLTTITEKGTKWGDLIRVSWDKKKSRKGKLFKDFSMESWDPKKLAEVFRLADPIKPEGTE